MAIHYDPETEGFIMGPDYCTDCEQPLYDTGCNAPGCLARICLECGTGCDIESGPEDGTCATALAEEGEEGHEARVAAERAAWGLPALPGGEVS